jgi:hypothetical protein
MAWEQRGSRRYYYRVSRSNGRVIKEYIGPGPDAVAAANEDAQRRAAREEDSNRANALEDELRPLEELLDRIGDSVNAIVSDVLTTNGFLQHRGSWRKHGKKRNAPSRPVETACGKTEY